MDHEGCTVCQLEFPHAEPNRGVIDAPIAGLGWGLLCEGHKGHAGPGATRLDDSDA